MTKQEILASLENFSEVFPRETIREAQKIAADITPELLEALDYAVQNASELYDEESDYFLHTYAMFLLAEFREKKAFTKLIAFLRLPEEHIEFILGDRLTEDFSTLLCSTFDGESLQMLKDIIEDRELFEYARSSAIRAYELLYWEGFVSQEEIIEFYRSLINDELVPDESHLATALVDSIINLRFTQMIPEVCFLYDNECVDTFICGRYDSFIDDMYSDKNYRRDKPYINDTIKDMEWWASFEDDGKKEYGERLEDVDNDEEDLIMESLIFEGVKKDMVQNPMVAQTLKKAGRNDPCPCGSGKKYKKCCYDKDQMGDRTPTIRLEDKYDLLADYPNGSPLFKEHFDEGAIKIDIPVYKALHHRAIPMWVQRDYAQERLGKIQYLGEALDLFLEKCKREQITSFTSFDEKYMVHYRSLEWVKELIKLTEDSYSDEIKSIRIRAAETLKEFGASG